MLKNIYVGNPSLSRYANSEGYLEVHDTFETYTVKLILKSDDLYKKINKKTSY